MREVLLASIDYMHVYESISTGYCHYRQYRRTYGYLIETCLNIKNMWNEVFIFMVVHDGEVISIIALAVNLYKIQLIETKNFLMYIETLLLCRAFFPFQITRSMTFFFYPSDLCMFIEKVVKLVDPYQGFFFILKLWEKKIGGWKMIILCILMAVMIWNRPIHRNTVSRQIRFRKIKGVPVGQHVPLIACFRVRVCARVDIMFQYQIGAGCMTQLSRSNRQPGDIWSTLAYHLMQILLRVSPFSKMN